MAILLGDRGNNGMLDPLHSGVGGKYVVKYERDLGESSW
jgi:hypothetical protein